MFWVFASKLLSGFVFQLIDPPRNKKDFSAVLQTFREGAGGSNLCCYFCWAPFTSQIPFSLNHFPHPYPCNSITFAQFHHCANFFLAPPAFLLFQQNVKIYLWKTQFILQPDSFTFLHTSLAPRSISGATHTLDKHSKRNQPRGENYWLNSLDENSIKNRKAWLVGTLHLIAISTLRQQNPFTTCFMTPVRFQSSWKTYFLANELFFLYLNCTLLALRIIATSRRRPRKVLI